MITRLHYKSFELTTSCLIQVWMCQLTRNSNLGEEMNLCIIYTLQSYIYITRTSCLQ